MIVFRKYEARLDEARRELEYSRVAAAGARGELVSAARSAASSPLALGVCFLAGASYGGGAGIGKHIGRIVFHAETLIAGFLAARRIKGGANKAMDFLREQPDASA